MLDFTSALYLGFRHASRSLPPWHQLTTGVPAALASPPGTEQVAGRLAQLQGCQQATLGTSTLHLFWDLFGTLDGEPIAIYMDAGVYPIARWGVERAAARQTKIAQFRHYDANALERMIEQDARTKRLPLVVADGFCPVCGHNGPLPMFLEIARRYGGYVLLDDTQSLGIFGAFPNPMAPFGREGGGSLRWHSAFGPDVLLISSLAKAFGVPVAVLSGSHAMVRRFEAKSETRVHCSPPSVATIHAAEHALNLNRADGDALRLCLARLIDHWHRSLKRIGLETTGGLFPVQTLKPVSRLDPDILHTRLLRQGIRTVLHRAHDSRQGAQISFILTTRHRSADIDRAVTALAYAADLPGVNTRLPPQEHVITD